MPTFLLSIFRNPYALGVLAVILVGGIQQARVWKAHADKSALESEISQQRQEWAQAEAAGEKAARAAVEAAVAAERDRQAKRIAEEAAAAERLREAAEKSAREAGEWRRRYREAAENNPSCAAWAAEVVQCPVM